MLFGLLNSQGGVREQTAGQLQSIDRPEAFWARAVDTGPSDFGAAIDEVTNTFHRRTWQLPAWKVAYSFYYTGLAQKLGRMLARFMLGNAGSNSVRHAVSDTRGR